NDYSIDWHANERTLNNKPAILDVEITTKNDPEVYINDPTGGYFDTEFTITATYRDIDNNLPKELWVVLDEGTGAQKKVNIVGNEVKLTDIDVSDPAGKEYRLVMTGEELRDDPSPHKITVYAYDDVPLTDIRSQFKTVSNYFYMNDSLRVWDDNPVKLVKTWPGLPVLSEDSQAEYVPLEGIDGAFDDPEKSFRGFNIWNPDIKGWVYDYEVMNPDDPLNVLVTVNVSKADGFWQAKLTLGANEHYSEGVPLLFRGYDDHSEINRSSRLIVNPVNDPPMVTSVKVGSVDYPADNTNPLLPLVHLDTQLTFKEDQLITFSIMAEDTDKENERTALEYSYEPNPSSPWEGNPLPQVDMTTGVVTYTATNGDVNKPLPNNKMVFTIDDRGADGDIKLTVYMKVDNVNDAPTLTIPAGTRSFQQFTTLAVKPQASDEDRGDTLKFEVNFESQIGDTPSVLDQLAYINPQKTLDWDLNENTGEFWFKLSDQNIWKTATGNQKTTSIVIAFKVTDKAGLSETKTVTFDLQDVNEEPPAPKKVTSVPADRQEVNKAVIFTVEEVVDPDGDKLYYKWNFGDGFTGEGVNVTHVYTLQGIKTVEVWVEDGQFQTDKYTYRIEIVKENVIPTDDDDDDDDDDTDPQKEFPIVLVIGGVFLILIILAFIIIALVVLRKKPAPPAAQYPYDPALMAYNYQGLPPGAPGQLPPGQAPELPPAPEYAGTELPPAQPEQPPVAPMTAPAAPPQPGPEQMGGACPSCNAPVDPSWFLCPNCKAPLQ
ncbi:MAG: PKD domain-containing protein, partial [Candidatus Thermoplasmatota archaeon]|nr:PKD domain-containing protein [Candidatus Thermoplasmatota archaeon]